MAFNPLPVDMPPGMWRNGTYYQANGKWWQGDMIRWENGRVKPIGGWTNILLPDVTFTGSTSGSTLTVTAVVGSGQILPGMTITGLTGGTTATLAIPNTGTGTGGTGTYTLTAAVATPTTSTTLTATSKFQGVPRAIITSESNTNAQLVFIGTNTHLYWGTGGIFQDITPAGFVPGGSDSIFSNGYGAGLYNDGSYGTPRGSDSFFSPLATWSFDNYGQNVTMVCTSDNKLYMWLTDHSEIGTEVDGTVTGVGQPLENSPNMISHFVTNEDYIMGLGTSGTSGPIESNPIVGRQIQWPDLDDVTDWTAEVTNSAGSLPLNTEGLCMSGARVGTINLIWTNVDVHQLNFIGTPGIYGATRLAGGCGLVSPNAWAVTDTAYWWSPGGFFYYNGVVKPLDCPVQDFIFRVVDTQQYDKVYAEVNSRFAEITWFFPSLNADPSVLGENDSYVTYNYKYGFWYYGYQSILGQRTCWADRGVFPLPMACSPDGILYDHETGYLADGVSRIGQVYVQSGPVETGGGAAGMNVDLLLPDIDPAPTSIDLNVQTQFTPDGPNYATEFGPIVPSTEGYFGTRFTGRQFAVKYTGTQDADWSTGTLRFNAKKAGKR